MEEKISTELKLTELRKRSFRQTVDQLHDRASSILSLTLQWKDIEDHFDSIHNVIEERAKELHSIRQSAEQQLEDVKKREKELEVVQESVEKRFREIEVREKEFELNQRKEIEERKREIESIENSRRELEGVREMIVKKLRVLGEIEQRFELFNKNIEERACQVKVVETEISKAVMQIERKEKHCEQFSNELKLKENIVEGQSKELVLKNENFSRQLLDFEVKEKKVEEQGKELRLKDERLVEKFKEFELKEKKIQVWCEQLELRNKKIMERDKELELKERQFEERYKEFELKEKHFIERYNNQVKIEQRNTYVVNSYGNLHPSVTMDGKTLQMFLNEHYGDHDSKRNEVLSILKRSSDPAKLVLDAMQGFYPPHLKKEGVEFEEGVVKRSCIMLLEQLRKLSPEIKPHVKKEAMGLAAVWITKMKADAKHSLEVLGYLQLLASYGLASAFDSDELLNQLEIVAQHSQTPELLRVLGFADKVSGFIQNLISKKQHVETIIGFIYAFKLVNKFPPIPLLKNYLNKSKSAAKKMRRENKSLEGQIEATNKRIADVKCALRCIDNYKIRYDPTLGKLKQQLDSLEKENKKRNLDLAALALKVRRPLWNKKKCLPPTVPAVDASVLAPKSVSTTIPALTSFPPTTSTSVPAPVTQSQQCSGIKRPWTAMTEEGNLTTYCGADQATCTTPFHVKIERTSLGDLPFESNGASSSLDPQPKPKCFSFDKSKDDLRRILNTHENHDLAIEVAATLRLACDPGKLVLDVMNTSHPFSLKENKDIKLAVPKRSCILLLEQLRSVTPQINSELKEEATRFALDWKPTLARKGKDPLEVICFLQFLAAYRLAFIFTADQLLGLLDADDWHEKVPDLVQVLGLADMIPNFIKNLIGKEQRIEAVRYIYALDMVDKFPPVPILKDHLGNFSVKNGKGNSIGVQIEAIVKEVKALEAVLKCIADYNIHGLSPEGLKRRIMQLKRQKDEKILIIEKSKSKVRPCSLSTSKLDQQQVSPVSAPTSATPPSIQLQQQTGNKRPRIHVSSEDRPKGSIGATSIGHPMHHPQQHSPSPPPDLLMNQRVPYMNAPPGHYNLAGYPPNKMHLNSYNANVISSYHRNTHGNPGHDRPMPY